MRHIDTDIYEFGMTDAEFFKLMDVEYPVATSKNSEPKNEMPLPEFQVHQSQFSIVKSLFPVAVTAILFVLIIV